MADDYEEIDGQEATERADQADRTEKTDRAETTRELIELPLRSLHARLGVELIDVMGAELPLVFTEVEAESSFHEKSVGVIDRSYRSLLAVTGSGARGFLHRIISSDVEKLDIGQGQLSVLLSAKGKTVGAFHTLMREENDYALLFDHPHDAEFHTAIEKYGFLDDIQIIDDTAEHCSFGFIGPQARELVSELTGCDFDLGESGDESTETAEGDPIRIHEAEFADERALVLTGVGLPGEILVTLPVDVAEEAWTTFVPAAAARGGGPVGFQASEILRVESGLPRFRVDFGPDNLPNEGGLEHALTYTKCYVGQEIVARLRTYGQANRCLRGLAFPGRRPSSPSSLLGARVTATRDGGDIVELGTISSSVASPKCGMIALSLVRRSHWKAGTVVTVVPHEDSDLHPDTVFDAVVRELPFLN